MNYPFSLPKRPFPDERGHFGPYGGRYVPETLVSACEELEAVYFQAKSDPAFLAEFDNLLKNFAGRPTPLYFAERLTEFLKGPKVYLKREDLCHTGAHKINNTLGQGLLARRMGKKRIIAETGAGQHGVATATVCARFGLECVIYMGEVDVARQAPNVFRMKLLGATVVPVSSGSKTLKDATNEAIRDWVTNVQTTHYIIGSTVGPHPYPGMVRDFQSVIGREAREQVLEKEGRLPDRLYACVGGGSNAMGLFSGFVDDLSVAITGVEAGGNGVQHCTTVGKGKPGVLHGSRSYLLQTPDGQVAETHSISAGLDYPGVGPEHSWLSDIGRAAYISVTDQEALNAFQWLCRLEGIIPALESSHAVAALLREAPKYSAETLVIVNLSGRGDKDIDIVKPLLHGEKVSQ